MPKKQLIIDQMDDGSLLVETVGYKGKVCQKEAASFLESALGSYNVKDFKEKAEWWIRNGRAVKEGRKRGIKIENHCG